LGSWAVGQLGSFDVHEDFELTSNQCEVGWGQLGGSWQLAVGNFDVRENFVLTRNQLSVSWGKFGTNK
jgi:hypothetical protein